MIQEKGKKNIFSTKSGEYCRGSSETKKGKDIYPVRGLRNWEKNGCLPGGGGGVDYLGLGRIWAVPESGERRDDREKGRWRSLILRKMKGRGHCYLAFGR